MKNLFCLGVIILATSTESLRAQNGPMDPNQSIGVLKPAIRHQNTHKHKPMTPNQVKGQIGDPLAGLTAAQLAAFTEGKDDFETAETVAGGLGPIFNRDSCVACHSAPTTGGSSSVNVTRFAKISNGFFDGFESLGGTLLQDHAIDPAVAEIIPSGANHTSFRNSTPLFGLGLIEAIPDKAILENARRTPGDGVKGRASLTTDIVSGKTMVGKFGWKAQQATILAFAADAYLNEMGITNRFFPTENAPNGDTVRLAQFDTVADPEDQVDPATGKTDVDKVADFMTFLAPPPSGPLLPSAASGKNIFVNLGCALCHTPSMMTDAKSPYAALRNKEVRLYSDLLLHNMGTLGDGIVQGVANGSEMRTAPLWGLKYSAPYLHDGTAMTIEDAIKAHDGEGKISKDRFNRLNKNQKQQLLDFLNAI